MNTVSLIYCSGVEGNSIYLNDYRIAGPKPWGGGRILKEWTVSLRDLKQAVASFIQSERHAAAQAQRERDAFIARSVSILADREKSCCGEAPEPLLRETIAETILATPLITEART